MQQTLRRIVWTAIALSAVSLALGMALYPGGTWDDPLAQQHRFLENFVCDLTHDPALNGRANVWGSRFATFGMVTLLPGLAAFWWLLAGVLKPSFAATMVRVSGLFSALGIALVALLPSNRVGSIHGLFVAAAVVPGLFAAMASVRGLWRDGHRRLAALGGVTLALAFADAVLYARHMREGGATGPWVPAIQKIAALCLYAWMLAATRTAARSK